MAVPRVLLLTGTPPGDEGVGELWLRDLCSAYPRGRMSCFAVTRKGAPHRLRALEWLPRAMVEWPHERPRRVVAGPVGGSLSIPATQYTRVVRTRGLERRATEFGRQLGADLVWAVLDQPWLYRVAPRVAARLGVPLVTSVWDPPERVTRAFGLDRLSRGLATRDFGAAMRASRGCAVMCETMQSEYEALYGTACVVMRHGMAPELRRFPPASEGPRERFVIGFAGGIYAEREWRALLAALASVGWKIHGKDVVLRVLGPDVQAGATGRAHLEYLGWRPMSEVTTWLSESDVNYLPYWFDASHRVAVRLCFPSKLTTYLASGRPVLYHGPEDSSPVRFFEKYLAGLSCHSLEAAEIVATLEKFDSGDPSYERMRRAGQAALDDELNSVVFLQRFARLIGIDAGDLHAGGEAPR